MMLICSRNFEPNWTTSFASGHGISLLMETESGFWTYKSIV